MTPYDRRGRDEPRDARSANRYRSKSRNDRRSKSRQSRISGHDGEGGIEERIKEHFDTGEKGLGAGIAGALIGGFAGRKFGDDSKRATAIGAIVGGLGANFLENQYQNYKEEKRYEERGSRHERPHAQRRRRSSR